MPIPALDANLNAARIDLLPSKLFDPDSFVLGEIISAKWIRSLDPQRVLIQVKGKELVAEADFPLPEKAAFQVRVDQVQPRVVLKFLTPNAKVSVSSSLLKKYLVGDPPLEKLAECGEALQRLEEPSLPKEVRETWTRIQETTRQFSGMLESGADPQALRRMIDQSGLNLEHNLMRMIAAEEKNDFPAHLEGDLKGLFLKVKAQLEGVAPERAREIQPILQKMELYQLLNAGEGDLSRVLLLLPLLFPEGLRWAEVLFSGDRQRGGPPADREKGLLFLLDLPALGKLQIQIQIRGTSMYGRLETADPLIGEYLEKNVSRLAGRLREAGYSADFEIRVVDPSLLQEILPARLEVFRDSLVSLVV